MKNQSWSLDEVEPLTLSNLSNAELMDMQTALHNEITVSDGERRIRCRRLFLRISFILADRSRFLI